MHNEAFIDYLAGVKYAEIAEKYHVSVNTVKSWKKRYWSAQETVQPKTGKVAKKVASKKEKVATKKTADIRYDALRFQVDKNDKLTEKQKLFCLFYIRNFNATQAYIKAYECTYDAAKSNGYELLTNTYIRAEIQRLKEIKRQAIMVSEDDVLDRYIKIAFSDMTDFVSFGNRLERVEDEATGEMVTVANNFLDFKPSDEVDGGLICEIKQGKTGMSIKLEDRQKALDKLAVFFDMFPDKFSRKMAEAKLELERKKLTEEDDEDGDVIIIPAPRPTTAEPEVIDDGASDEED